MNKPCLEVTYRQGKPFAAYHYLRRQPSDRAETTRNHDQFLIDYRADGRAIGVEFTHVTTIDLAALNRVLQAGDVETLSAADPAPLSAA